MKKTLVLILQCYLLTISAFAQSPTQTIKGTILDADSKLPLIGANVILPQMGIAFGTTTDVDGYFRIEEVPIGRHTIAITYLGYKPIALNCMLITSGKEVVLNLELQESAETLDEIVVKASESDKTKPLNEMASVSARTFSVEESSRYAAAAYDPARMAQNYAGVSVGSTDDLTNEIVIRGNSPKGILWKLEGVEISSPNHFGGLGGGGGAISMISTSMLSNSDFYTGAFPAEYGNALSGVFDLKLRNGNNEKAEYAFMLGGLGLEAAAEGPFKKGSKASYLVNYRYSTLAILEALGVNPAGDVLPKYQDLSFKLNFPTQKAGTFGVFGIGGFNNIEQVAKADSTKWKSDEDMYTFQEYERRYMAGITHSYLFSDNAYIKTQLSANGYYQIDDESFLDPEENYKQIVEYSDRAIDNSLRFSTQYNKKFSAKNTMRIGLIGSQLDYIFQAKEGDQENNYKLHELFDTKGESQFLQAYGQWQHRPNNDLTFNAGLHYSHFLFNNSKSLEPRLGMRWDFKENQALSAAVGLHSKLDHLVLYMGEGVLPDGTLVPQGKDLKLTKSSQFVLGYDLNPTKNFRIKMEAYYQYIYDVATSTDPNQKQSILTTDNAWQYIERDALDNSGRGRNVGLDITLEKFFAKNYYYMVTGSIFDSKFSPKDKKWYNTRYNTNYQFNIVGGKEFIVGKNKNRRLGLNAKFVTSGGNRTTPIDFAASAQEGRAVYLIEKTFEKRNGAYLRLDLGVSYKINFNNATHSINLDIQNVTDNGNIYGEYYHASTNSLRTFTQTGLLPFFNYRIEF